MKPDMYNDSEFYDNYLLVDTLKVYMLKHYSLLKIYHIYTTFTLESRKGNYSHVKVTGYSSSYWYPAVVK